MSSPFWTQFHPRGDSLADFAHQHLTTDVKNKRTSSNEPIHPSALSPEAPFGFRSPGMRLLPSRPSSTADGKIHSPAGSLVHQPGLLTLSTSLWEWLWCSQCYTWNRQRHSFPLRKLCAFRNLFAPSAHSEHLPCVRNKCRQIATSLGGVGGECYSFGIPCLAEHLAWKETQKGFLLAKEWFAPLATMAKDPLVD